MKKIKSVRLGVSVEKIRELTQTDLGAVNGGNNGATLPTVVNGETQGCKYTYLPNNHNVKRLVVR